MVEIWTNFRRRSSSNDKHVPVMITSSRIDVAEDGPTFSSLHAVSVPSFPNDLYYGFHDEEYVKQ
jgi:hypothetical protein